MQSNLFSFHKSKIFAITFPQSPLQMQNILLVKNKSAELKMESIKNTVFEYHQIFILACY